MDGGEGAGWGPWRFRLILIFFGILLRCRRFLPFFFFLVFGLRCLHRCVVFFCGTGYECEFGYGYQYGDFLIFFGETGQRVNVFFVSKFTMLVGHPYGVLGVLGGGGGHSIVKEVKIFVLDGVCTYLCMDVFLIYRYDVSVLL